MRPCPRILFLSLTNNDLMNGPVSAFAKAGCACAVMSPPEFICAQSRFATRHFPLPRHRGLWLGFLGVRPGLERALRDWSPDLVVPLDDAAARLLRGLAVGRSVSAELAHLLQRSLGSPSGYQVTGRRAQFLALAGQIGVRAPRSLAASPATALEAAEKIGYPVALKRENSCAGFGVTIAKDATELQAAIVATGFGGWRSLLRHWALLQRANLKLQQLVARLAGGGSEAKAPFEVQQFVPGASSAFRVVAAWQGQVLAGISFERSCVNRPPIGNVTVMRHMEHAEMAASTERIVAALGYSGFALVDFMIQEDTGHAYVIELNARTTGIVHLGPCFGHDVCGALARQLGLAAPSSDPVAALDERPIVLFPRELERDPNSAWLQPGRKVHHDVPWDDPSVLEVYYRRLLRRHPAHAAIISRLLGLPIPVPRARSFDSFRKRVGIGVRQ